MSPLNQHINECHQCRINPFDLCRKGRALIRGVALGIHSVYVAASITKIATEQMIMEAAQICMNSFNRDHATVPAEGYEGAVYLLSNDNSGFVMRFYDGSCTLFIGPRSEVDATVQNVLQNSGKITRFEVPTLDAEIDEMINKANQS